MKDTTQRVQIRLTAGYAFASDAITNGFASDYYLGKFITEERKDQVTKNLSALNLFAGHASGEIAITFHPDTGNRNVEGYIAVRQLASIDSRFSNDLFEVFFRGNKKYAGRTADLGDFFLQQFTYRQYVVGINNAFTLGRGILYAGANIAINHGLSFQRYRTSNATLFTASDGNYIDADLNAMILTDDSSSSHPSKLDGNGYSGDFYLEYSTENSLLRFSAENFGSIKWNKWSTRVAVDTTFHFDGIDVQDLFEFEDSIRVTDANLDSVYYKNFLNNKKEERITTRLPMRISGSYTRAILRNQLSAIAGIDMYLNRFSTFRYIAGLDYRISRSSSVLATFAYGGFTKFHGGIHYTHVFPWHLKVEIGSNYVYPMVLYDEGLSQGAYVSLSKRF